MRVGSENKTKLWIMVALLAISIPLLFSAIFSSKDSPQVAANTAATDPGTANTSVRNATRQRRFRYSSQPVDPTLRLDLLQSSEETVYHGRGRNIFRGLDEIRIPKPVAPVLINRPPSAPTGPPPPPPIGLKFFGFASKPGEPKKIFLSDGEDIFIGSEGDIVARRYKIIRIGTNSAEVEDVLNNNRQMLPLIEG